MVHIGLRVQRLGYCLGFRDHGCLGLRAQGVSQSMATLEIIKWAEFQVLRLIYSSQLSTSRWLWLRVWTQTGFRA